MAAITRFQSLEKNTSSKQARLSNDKWVTCKLESSKKKFNPSYLIAISSLLSRVGKKFSTDENIFTKIRKATQYSAIMKPTANNVLCDCFKEIGFSYLWLFLSYAVFILLLILESY